MLVVELDKYIQIEKQAKGRACTKTCNRKRRSTGKASYDEDDDDEAGFRIDAFSTS